MQTEKNLEFLIKMHAPKLKVFDSMRLENWRDEEDEELDDLDEAEKRHAQKEVQVAADNADQVHPGHLPLLDYLRVGELVVVDGQLDEIAHQRRSVV